MDKVRLTKQSLIPIVNAQLVKNELPYTVTNVETTKYTAEQYEAGAARIVFTLKHDTVVGEVIPFKMFCMYSIKELQEHCNSEYELSLKRRGLSDEMFKELAKEHGQIIVNKITSQM